ncbi:MAG TPA: HAMP domain-containing protein [Nitrospirota bacterium]
MAYISVRIKILMILVATSLLFGLGMVLFAETVIQKKLHVKLQEKGVVLATRAAADSINPIITERYFEITMMLKDMMASEHDIVYAYVLDADDRELAHTFAKGVPPELKLANPADPLRPYSTDHVRTDKGLVHDIAVPLLRGQLGVLHLGLSDNGIQDDVNDIVISIILFSVFVLLVGTAVSVGFSHAITSPLSKLVGAAEAFGRGERYHPVSIRSEDEIGELANSFNVMIERRKQSEAEREQLISDLKTALTKVKTLSGLLPICASCKKVRDDKGYWNQIDAYISEHSDAEISHSLCPECAQKLYPELWEKMKKME